jgi:hypothetical protein
LVIADRFDQLTYWIEFHVTAKSGRHKVAQDVFQGQNAMAWRKTVAVPLKWPATVRDVDDRRHLSNAREHRPQPRMVRPVPEIKAHADGRVLKAIHELDRFDKVREETLGRRC